MVRKSAGVLVGALAVVGAASLVGSLWFFSHGISADPEPPPAEVALARQVRRLATPVDLRARRNPEPATAENLRSGLEHFADHCAGCHANDGSGAVPIGRRLYPRAPDMRLAATQDLADGELFSIIEHGVRLTGMPGWGTGTSDGARASWHLVYFIRHLRNLTEDEQLLMRTLNPKTADEWREEDDARRFLAGENPAPLTRPARRHGDHGR